MVESYAADTVPLYWGDPNVSRHFNKNAFLQIDGKKNFPHFIRELQGIIGDYEAYREIYEQPLFPDNREPDFLKAENIADFLEARVTAGKVRTSFDPVSHFQIYRWSTRWKFKEWDYRKKKVILFLELFTAFGFLFNRSKQLVKRLFQVKM